MVTMPRKASDAVPGAPVGAQAPREPRVRRPSKKLADATQPVSIQPVRAPKRKGPASARAPAAPKRAKAAPRPASAAVKPVRASRAERAVAGGRSSAKGVAKPPVRARRAAADKGAEALAQKEATKAYKKAQKKAAADEQRQLREEEKRRKKAAAAVEKAAAADEQRQARRVPPSASRETASDASTCQLLAEVAVAFVAADPDDAAPRRALLAPLLPVGEPDDDDAAGEPSWAADLLGFAQAWRKKLHVAFGNATELPSAQHAMANLTLRLEAVGPGARAELSQAWLKLAGVVPGERGANARLSLFWNETLSAFKRLNVPAGRKAKAVPEQLIAREDAGDRTVMGVPGGWAVFSLRSKAKNKPALQWTLPLLDALMLPDGAGSGGLTDPATLYLLARQQFGGLTALTLGALTFFDLAQRVLSSHLTKQRIAEFGIHTFQFGVNAVLANQGVSSAFSAQMPAGSLTTHVVQLRALLLSKFFNQAQAQA